MNITKEALIERNFTESPQTGLFQKTAKGICITLGPIFIDEYSGPYFVRIANGGGVEEFSGVRKFINQIDDLIAFYHA